MRVNAKLIVLVLVFLAVGAIFVLPYLKSEPEFTATSQPGAALKEAKDAGQPVFLEFYSPT